MSNGYSHLKEVFEIGDVYSFFLGHFENMKDVNVQKMERLCRKTVEFFFKIMDLNGVNENEVNLNEE